jgi:hypothetical protein
MRLFPSFRHLEHIHAITWQDLAALEPRLGELLWAARQACVTCRRWSDVDRAFAPIRDALGELVGFGGKHRWHPVLGSAEAYQVAHWKLYDAVAALLPGWPGAEARPAAPAAAGPAAGRGQP